MALPSAPDVLIGTFVAKARGSDISVETTRGGVQTSYRVLRGQGSYRTGGTTTYLPPYNTFGMSLDILPLFARWTEFLDADTTVQYSGTVALGGIQCHRIRVEKRETSEHLFRRNEHGKTEVFLDIRTGLVAAIRYRATAGRSVSDQVTIENRFFDYRDNDGLLLPARIVQYVVERPSLVLRVSGVRFNNSFTDAEFHR